MTERKLCGYLAALIASAAIWQSPEVPFLKPTGIDSPDVNSRCTCEQVCVCVCVRARQDANMIKVWTGVAKRRRQCGCRIVGSCMRSEVMHQQEVPNASREHERACSWLAKCEHAI